MLVGHGKTNCKIEKVAERRNLTSFRGLVDQNNYKECEAPELASRSSYDRWIISAVIGLPTNAYWKLSSFLPPLQMAGQKNHFGSIAPSCMDGLQSMSLPSSSIFMPSENADSVKLVSFSSSSGANTSGQSQNRNRLLKPVNSSTSTSSPGRGLVSGNSSGSVNNLNADCSNFLNSNIPVVEKVVKRYPRTSRKKKGKQYKQTAQEEVSTVSNVQCNKSAYSVFAFEKSMDSILSSSGKRVFDNLSDKAMPPSLSVQDFTVDGENNNEKMDCSTTLQSCTSYGDEMDDSELIASPQKFSSKKFSRNSITYQNIASTTTQAAELVRSTFAEYIKDVCSIENTKFLDNSLSTSMDENVSVVDSFLDGWSCNVTTNSDGIEMQSILEKEGRENTSEVVLSSGSWNFDTSFHTINVDSRAVNNEMLKNCYIGNPSNDILSASSKAKTGESGSQACSSNEFHPVISGRRGRMGGKVIGSQSINVANRFGPANSQGPRGKDTKHAVWQERHKSDTEACAFKPNNVALVSAKDDEASNASMTIMQCDKFFRMKEKTRRSCKYPCSDKIASDAVRPGQTLAKPTVDNLTDNVESKSCLKQPNHFSRGEYFTVKTYIPKVLKHQVHKKEGLQTSELVHHERTSLGSPSITNSQHNPSGLVDHCPSRPAQGICAPGKAVSPSNICGLGCNRTPHAAHTEIGQLSEELHLKDQKLTEVNHEKCNSMYFMDMDEDRCCLSTKYKSCMKLETESSYTESCDLQHVTRTMLKWVSLGEKKSVVSDMGHDIEVPVVDEAYDKSDSRDSKVDAMISNNHYLHPSTRDGFRSLNSSSRETKVSSAEFALSTSKSRICSHSAEAICDLDALSNCRTHELKTQEIGPVANFEKFLYSASPVIGHAHCNASCSTCEEQLIGRSLCWHQIPNISLKSLWHWYEEPSCFGLESKAEVYKKLDNSTFEFNAYFVPYLSAVQLFGNSERRILIGESAISSKVDKTSNTLSYLESLPIFSMLLPQPQKEISESFSELSSTQHDPAKLVKTKNAGDGKLIFEFFESEQPPCRRPLFEKIRELVDCHTLRNSQVFGNPLELESMNLHDLHPASWFSVAWYPIYRIPDGKFRAAFLTYHSLGHFVHQSVSSCSPSALVPIVCPVVGLLVYNDKGESWFEPRDLDSKAIQSEEVLYSNPSELLKERLRTLKQTASLMARAVVSKGNQKSVNQHPDHEFFLSRNW